MPNYILGDVLNAEAFVRDNNGKLVHYFSAKTMTESTINVSVSAEEIRGGWGNQLLGKIFHDTNFVVNLTEAMFSMSYLAAQIGSDITAKTGDAANFVSMNGATVGVGTLTFTPTKPVAKLFQNSGTFCSGSTDKYICWAKDCAGHQATYEFDAADGEVLATKIAGEDLEGSANDICVTYPTNEKAAEQLIVKAAFEPKEFSLHLKGKVFAGDSCGKSKTGKVGNIIIEIPRFQLDGTADLSFSPSSNVSVALNGSALAFGCDCGDEGEKQYAKISIVLDSTPETVNPYKGYTGIVVENAESLVPGMPLIIWAVGNKKKPIPYKGSFTAVKTGTQDSILTEQGLVIAKGAEIVNATITATDIQFKEAAGGTAPSATATIAARG